MNKEEEFYKGVVDAVLKEIEYGRSGTHPISVAVDYGRDNPKECEYKRKGLAVALSCTICNHSVKLLTYKFCPNCGRKIKIRN